MVPTEFNVIASPRAALSNVHSRPTHGSSQAGKSEHLSNNVSPINAINGSLDSPTIAKGTSQSNQKSKAVPLPTCPPTRPKKPAHLPTKLDDVMWLLHNGASTKFFAEFAGLNGKYPKRQPTRRRRLDHRRRSLPDSTLISTLADSSTKRSQSANGTKYLKEVDYIKRILAKPHHNRSSSGMSFLANFIQVHGFSRMWTDMHPIILRCLCQAMFFKAVKEDTVIFREGDVGDNFYYIVHGVVSLWQHKAEEEQTADEIRAERWDSLAAKLLEEDKVTKFVVAEAHKKIDTQQLSHIDQLLQKVALDMGVKSAKLLKEMHGLYDDVTDAQSLEFMKFDVDGTGSLSKEEFRNFYADWCHRHGKQVHIEQLDRLFDALDTDHSGSLSTNEVESQRLAHAAPATPLLPPNVHREHASSLHAPRAIDTVSHAPGPSAGEQTRPLAAEQRTELKELELQMQSLRGLGGAKGRPKHRRKHKPMNPHGLLNKVITFLSWFGISVVVCRLG
jgi:hypothetical protein